MVSHNLVRTEYPICVELLVVSSQCRYKVTQIFVLSNHVLMPHLMGLQYNTIQYNTSVARAMKVVRKLGCCFAN